MPAVLLRTIARMAAHAAAAALNHLAADTASRVGGGLGVLVWRLGVRRRVTSRNLALVLGLAGWERARVARRSYATIGASFVELWAIGGPDGPERHVRALNPRWQGCLLSAPGVVFSTLHLGNWDMAAHAVARACPRVLVYAKVQRGGGDGLINRQRARAGMEVLFARGDDRRSAVTALRAVQGGAVLGLLADQRPSSGEGLPAWFLGQATRCHAGPGFFAKRAGCPLVVGFCLRVRAGRYVFFAGRPLPAGADEAALVQRSLDHLSAVIAAFPGQYFWQHKRFSGQPPDIPARAVEPWRRHGLRLLVGADSASG